jgi:hypothetical protein
MGMMWVTASQGSGMKVRVEHPDFMRRRLKVASAGWWGGPQLFQDGARVMSRRGVHLVTTDSGDSAAVRLRYDFVDPMPSLRIGRQIVHLLRPFHPLQYLWLCLPVLLVLVSGLPGLLVGLAAAHTNGLLFRAQEDPRRAYAHTGLASLAALLIAVFLSTLLHAAWDWGMQHF